MNKKNAKKMMGLAVDESFIVPWADTPQGGAYIPKEPGYAAKDKMRWKMQPVDSGILVTRLADSSVEYLGGVYDYDA